MDSTRLASIL